MYKQIAISTLFRCKNSAVFKIWMLCGILCLFFSIFRMYSFYCICIYEFWVWWCNNYAIVIPNNIVSTSVIGVMSILCSITSIFVIDITCLMKLWSTYKAKLFITRQPILERCLRKDYEFWEKYKKFANRLRYKKKITQFEFMVYGFKIEKKKVTGLWFFIFLLKWGDFFYICNKTLKPHS